MFRSIIANDSVSHLFTYPAPLLVGGLVVIDELGLYFVVTTSQHTARGFLGKELFGS